MNESKRMNESNRRVKEWIVKRTKSVKDCTKKLLSLARPSSVLALYSVKSLYYQSFYLKF